MNWWGKILGGAFGMMIGGPIGALLGVALGHNFDKGMRTSAANDGLGKQERIQTLFYTTTFSVMGHVCKADGRVSEDEIKLAQQVMQQMEMQSDQRQAAIRLFNEGKKPDFPLNDVIQQFRKEIGFRPNLIRMFIEIQIMAAYADGVMDASERAMLLSICSQLHISEHDFDHLCHMIGGLHHGGRGSSGGQAAGMSLEQAYDVLDVPGDAKADVIKKAYRRLMSQHHPDKLVAKGLPEEMMKLAEERTREIRKAYEIIKEARGL